LKARDYISIDRKVPGGCPVFKGTRLPGKSPFRHLEKGIPLDEFLKDFPTVKKKQAIAAIKKGLIPGSKEIK